MRVKGFKLIKKVALLPVTHHFSPSLNHCKKTHDLLSKLNSMEYV